LADNLKQLTQRAVFLLEELIRIPSFSREESETADLIYQYLEKCGLEPIREGNNVWVLSDQFDESKPTILLNSHHDTVKPVQGWTRDPYSVGSDPKCLFGLGSNDAGASLVSLIHTFLFLNQDSNRSYNLIMAASAEEEISGKNGIASILPSLGNIALGIVGEPTLLEMAVAEKGLMVLDCYAKGISGHAAREEGENAIYKAMQDIAWFQSYQFDKSSDLLGAVKMSVTQVGAGTQHNVVPDSCHFVVDVRTNELYSNQEVYELVQSHVSSEVKPRSFRLNSSGIAFTNPVVQKGISMGLGYYGSPTLSDQALMSFPTLKIGPGDSARSHTANEYILIEEIEKGIKTYIEMLSGLEI
ncbi:MAG: M20 family metallo-hydrolase, partial [Bacteroidota bacterium]